MLKSLQKQMEKNNDQNVNDKTINGKEEKKPIDNDKRNLFFNLGSLGALTVLTACAPAQYGSRLPEAKSTDFVAPSDNVIFGNDENSILVQPGSCSPVTPPGAVPAPEGTQCSPAITINALQVAAAASQTFVSLGPDNIVVEANNMTMANQQLMANGSTVSVWTFTDMLGAGFNARTDRICPGPVLEVIEGQLSTVALRSMHPHTLHLHGLDVDQANDGVPSTSGYVAAMPSANPPATPPANPPGNPPANPPPMGGNPPANPPGNPPANPPPMGGQPPAGGMGPIPAPEGAVLLSDPFYYTFIAPHAGTYMYHCHVDTVLHMEMGMSGTIIVRPADGSRTVSWTGGEVFDKEYIWQLHTFDSAWHSAGNRSGVNTMRYSPDYFMINGLDGANILTDPTSAISAAAGQRILIRVVNLGYIVALVNLSGILFDVESSDGRPLAVPKLGLNELLLGPGEKYDIFFTMPDVSVPSVVINYLDIMGQRVIGQAVSSITVI